MGYDDAEVFTVNSVTDGFYLSHIGHPDWLVVSSKPLKDTTEKVDFPENEMSADVIPDFGNVWQAPVDRLDEIKEIYGGNSGDVEKISGYLPPKISRQDWNTVIGQNVVIDCQVHATCGFELTPYGYTPCPCGGGRVVGDPSIFFGSLSEITLDECNKKLARMCATCGRNLNYSVLCKNRSQKTEFWDLILKKYKRDKPKLPLYDPFNKRPETPGN